jgi:hypothetical protein
LGAASGNQRIMSGNDQHELQRGLKPRQTRSSCSSSGAIALFVYLLIAVAELRMRRQLEREGSNRL